VDDVCVVVDPPVVHLEVIAIANAVVVVGVAG
jgi:hypothetical protein